MGYVPYVYKTSGGDQMVVTTGGVLNFASGTLTVGANTLISSGGGVALASLTSGAVTFEGAITANGGYREYVEVATSSWTAITYNYGVSVVVGSSGGQVLLAMPAPAAGVHKLIFCIDGTAGATGAAIITSSGAGATVGIGNTSILMTTGATVQQWIHLVGRNTTQWLVASMSTDVSLSAT